MRWSLAAGAAAILIAASGPAAEPRQPTAKWVVNFDDAQCFASRNYGTVEDPLFLVLKSPPLGNVMQLAVMRKGDDRDPDQYDATLKVDERPPLRASVLVYKSRDASLRTYRINLPTSDFAQIGQAKKLVIRSLGLNESFALSNMEPLLKTMDACLIDLRSVWNVTDPSGKQSRLKERAQGNLAQLVSNDDYPAVAIHQGQSGVVAFVLLVNEAGKVADCTVIETSGAAALDSQTCATMKIRGQLTPAIGADGKPAKDALIGKIRWQMINRRDKAPFD